MKYHVEQFSKHCSKVKEPTHHPRLQPSKHAKQNSGAARGYTAAAAAALLVVHSDAATGVARAPHAAGTV